MREDQAILDSLVNDKQMAPPGEQFKPGFINVNDEANPMEL